MIPVKNKLRVVHFPQVDSCRKSFKVEVKDEYEAYKIMTILANQHLWLLENNIIPDYSNSIFVEMWCDDEADWSNYYNNEEVMDWDELESEYFNEAIA